MKREVTLYSCDRCGAESEDSTTERVALTRSGRGRWKDHQINIAELDLCGDCTEGVEAFIKVSQD